MRDLLIRTATSVVLVAIVLAAMLVGRITFAILSVLIATGCTIEFGRLAPSVVAKWSGGLYIVLCMAALWFFPFIGSGVTAPPHAVWDVRIALAFMITVWANDTFAYLTGMACGRHKMAKTLSPHKSWEGFAGGVVGAMTVAAVMGRFWMGASACLWAAFGLVVALAAVSGDLVESRFKRAAGVKDSGRLLPGHGGVLDRFDATLGAVPVAFMFFLVTWLVG